MFVLFRNRFKTRSYTLIMVSLLCMPAAEGFAQHEHAHGDILFTIDDVTGELATGSIANQSNVLTLEGQNVYEVELDDPGVFGLGHHLADLSPECRVSIHQLIFRQICHSRAMRR